MDDPQIAGFVLDPDNLQWDAVFIVTEVHEAALARGIIGCRLVERQAAVLDDVAHLVVSDSLYFVLSL